MDIKEVSYEWMHLLIFTISKTSSSLLIHLKSDSDFNKFPIEYKKPFNRQIVHAYQKTLNTISKFKSPRSLFLVL
jgi:hypothetical protein